MLIDYIFTNKDDIQLDLSIVEKLHSKMELDNESIIKIKEKWKKIEGDLHLET